MKKSLIFISILIVFCGFIKNKNYNYITSNYYQLIYEADTAYLVGNYEFAYKKLQEAEKKMPLIEQPMYYEISRYVELLIKHQNYKKALFYINILVKDYGYPIKIFENEDYFTYLQQNTNWDKQKKRLNIQYEKFYEKVDTNLLNTLIIMYENDQKLRKELNINPNKALDTIFLQQFAYIDSINEIKIKEIFKNYGFPNDKMFGRSNNFPFKKPHDITAILMHFSDTAYFKPILLEFIKKGECSPRVLGNFVDSYERRDTAKLKYTYGIYQNTRDQIKDIKHLDQRRKSIGMPPLEIELKRDSIIKKIYNIQ